MDSPLSYLSNYIPEELELLQMLKFIGIVGGAVLVLGFVIRLLLGRKSEINHALSSAMGILSIYAVSIAVYTFNPYELSRFLSPLPFVSFSESYVLVLPLTTAPFPELCSQILSMVILAFLVNLLDVLTPTGEGILSWFFWRVLCVVLSMGAHLVITWALNAFLPGVVASYAQIILLGILIVLLLLGLLKLMLGLLVGAIDPMLGALSAFFFSNIAGKQLSKSVFTTALLCGVAYLLERTGFTVICITTAALSAYVPLIAVLLVLWYMIGNLL